MTPVFIFSKDNEHNIMIHLKLENQFMLPKEITDYSNLIIKYVNNKIYIFECNKKEIIQGDTIPIYVINDQKIKKLLFTVPQNIWIFNFDIYDNKLFILGQNELLIYLIDNENLNLIKNIKMFDLFLDIKVYKNKIILTKRCWSCMGMGIKTTVFDTSGELMNNHEFSRSHGFQLELWSPKKRFDYYNDKYIVSNILDYNVTIFNDKYDTICKLSRNISIFDKNKDDTSFNDTITYNDWVHKNSIIKNKLAETNRMDLTEFIDDTTILICYSDRSQSSVDCYHHDIWRLNSNINKWELYKSDLIDRMNKTEDDTIMMEFVAYTILNNYQVSNGKIFSLQYIPIEINKYDITNMTYKELYKIFKEYFEKNDPIKSLFMYSIK